MHPLRYATKPVLKEDQQDHEPSPATSRSPPGRDPPLSGDACDLSDSAAIDIGDALNVLHIAHHPRDAELVAALLARAAAQAPRVVAVTSLKAGIERIREGGFDAALSDLHLSDAGGIGTLRCLVEVDQDRSFIADVPGDADGEAITRAVIALGRALRLKVVAEGVETREQLDFLAREGCDEVQGFYFSRPLRHAEMAAWRGPGRRPAPHPSRRLP